jgi:hypothetical protein
MDSKERDFEPPPVESLYDSDVSTILRDQNGPGSPMASEPTTSIPSTPYNPTNVSMFSSTPGVRSAVTPRDKTSLYKERYVLIY